MSKLDGIHSVAEIGKHAIPDAVAFVIEAIESDIIRGRILPRTRLIEDHLMDDYSAKRHVVRAALTELERLGVVVKPPHLGAQIRRFDKRSLDDLYRMRGLLHHAAIAMIPLPMTAERLHPVKTAMHDHAEAAASGDILRINRANMAFHREFYGLCENPYLAESIRLHDWLSFPARAYGVADADALRQACEEHAQMVEALDDGDRDLIQRLAAQHMVRARDLYAARFFST